MALANKVVCYHCGTEFPAASDRCPSCGARRIRTSSRAPGTTAGAVKGTPAGARAEENGKWQLIFGAILLAAIVVALIVMITVSLNTADLPDDVQPTTPPDITAEPEQTPAPTPTPTPMPEITDLNICYNGTPIGSDFTEGIGEDVALTGAHFPLTIPGDYKWSSSAPEIAKVSEDGVVTGVAAGVATVTLTCYGKTAQVVVYVRA